MSWIGLEMRIVLLLFGVATQLDALILLPVLVHVALEILRNVDTKDEGSISVTNLSLIVRICIYIGIVIVTSTFQSIESHANKFLLQKSEEQELKCLSNAYLGDGDLPEVTLCQIGVGFHHVPQLLIVFI
jgi:hypothetical protein